MKKRTAVVLLGVGIAALIVVLVWGIASGPSFWSAASPARAYGPADTEVFSEDVPSSGVRNIEVNLVSEDVQIAAGDEDTIHITQYGPEGIDQRYLIKVSEYGDTLRVEASTQNRNWVFFGWSSEPYTRVVITVPKALAGRLNAQSLSGAVKLGEISARECTLVSTSGNVSVRGVEAERIEATTTSGSVNVSATSADEMHTAVVSGRVTIDDGSSAERLSAAAVSGEIICRMESLGGFECDSTSGSVLVSIADAALLKQITASTISGSVEVSLPAGTVVNPDFSSLSGALHTAGNGTDGIVISGDGIPIDVTTTSGDLRITAA